MIKGCQKNIIFLKNTESELFDEAYFVMKPNAPQKSEKDIIWEATRLVNGFDEETSSKRSWVGGLLFFLAGLLTGIFASLLLCSFLI